MQTKLGRSSSMPHNLRPHWWLRLFLALLAAFLPLLPSRAARPTERPNVLIMAISAETGQGSELLDGTPYALPQEFAPGRVLYAFAKPGDSLDWKLDGAAFSVSSEPRLFPSFVSLNSLTGAGETATGQAVSPEFTIRHNELSMILELQGGQSATVDGQCNLCIRLVDTQSSAVPREVLPKGSHIVAEERVGLEGLQGKRVRLELVDRNTAPTCAWIGLRKVTLTGNVP